MHKHRRKNGIAWACDCDEFDAVQLRIERLNAALSDSLAEIAALVTLLDKLRNAGDCPLWAIREIDSALSPTP